MGRELSHPLLMGPQEQWGLERGILKREWLIPVSLAWCLTGGTSLDKEDLATHTKSVSAVLTRCKGIVYAARVERTANINEVVKSKRPWFEFNCTRSLTPPPRK